MTTSEAYAFAQAQVAWIGWALFAAIVFVPLALWIRRARADHESALDPALEGVRDLKKRWGFPKRVLTALVKKFPFVTADRVTISRIPLLVFTVALYVLGWSLEHALYLAAFGVHAVNAIFDFIDGTIALIRGGTEYGKWLDPLVDKIVHAVILAAIGAVWLLQERYAVFAAFLVPIAGSLAYAYLLTRERARGGAKDPAAKPHGKLKAVCESVATCAVLLGQWSSAPTVFLVDAWILLTVSVLLARRSLQSQREPPRLVPTP